MASIFEICLMLRLLLVLLKGKRIDLSPNGLNVVALSPNLGVKFFESYTWAGMSEVEPIEIFRAVMYDLDLSEVEKPFARDLNVHSRLLHHMNEDDQWVKKAVATPSQEIQEEEAEEEDLEEVEAVAEDRPEDNILVAASPRTPHTPTTGRSVTSGSQETRLALLDI
ncbi:hypothetical protein CJ030_MR1G002652 [Morella rubra]|uniref:Uncharacterized protein n=1 Tax=Morella rubra TaxID=262757 RepID=A0A6A1WNK1_9ROSI|nr:hypothetical protein CJ030_MR1G002652 [Morella rubra]